MRVTFEKHEGKEYVRIEGHNGPDVILREATDEDRAFYGAPSVREAPVPADTHKKRTRKHE